REARLLLDAHVGAFPLLLHDVGRGLHRQAALAAFDRLDFDLHRRSTLSHAPRWCERGESNPQGLVAHWILSPARLPVSPLSREVRAGTRPCSLLRTRRTRNLQASVKRRALRAGPPKARPARDGAGAKRRPVE